MSKTRVADLERFALEQIWRPYQTKMGYEERLDVIPMSLDATADLLRSDNSGWAETVLDRISRIGFAFPPYIDHPLVKIVCGSGGYGDDDALRDLQNPSFNAKH